MIKKYTVLNNDVQSTVKSLISDLYDRYTEGKLEHDVKVNSTLLVLNFKGAASKSQLINKLEELSISTLEFISRATNEPIEVHIDGLQEITYHYENNNIIFNYGINISKLISL